jgi:hypothetical protein
MTGEVADAGVEDVIQSVAPKEEIANHSQAFSIVGICPKSTKICYGVYCLFLTSHQWFKARDGKMIEKKKLLHLFVVLLDPGDYPLSKIFRDIFGLVFKPLELSTSPFSPCPSEFS